MKKRFFAALLSFIMVFSLLPVNALAFDGGHNGPGRVDYHGSDNLYVTVMAPGQSSWPNEPCVSSYPYYFMKGTTQFNSAHSGQEGWSYTRFSTSASNYINIDAFSKDIRVRTSTSKATVKAITNSTGLNLSSDKIFYSGKLNADAIKKAYLSIPAVKSYFEINDVDTEAENYELIAYVLKYEQYSDASAEPNGWHLDCAVVKRDTVKLTYDKNFPTSDCAEYGNIFWPENRELDKGSSATIGNLTDNRTTDKGTAEIYDRETNVTYKFLGWSTDATAKTADAKYNPDTEVKLDSDLHLYAVWQSDKEPEPETVTITFDANGGKWNEDLTDYAMNTEKTTASKAGLSLDTKVSAASAPANDKESYVGWAFSPTAGALKNQFDKDKDGTVTFYAIWEETSQPSTDVSYYVYKHCYVGNEKKPRYNEEINIPRTASSGTLITSLITDADKADVVANGITYRYDSSKTKVNDGSLTTGQTVKDGDIIHLYYYADTTEYTLSYDSNANGDSVTGMPDPSSAAATTISGYYDFTVSENVPQRAGYTFTGWNTKADGTGTKATGTITLTAPDTEVTLYAQWETNSYKVTYQYIGDVPANAPAAPEAQDHEYRTSVTIAATPTLAGYTFHGWYTDEACTEEATAFNMPNYAVTLYGKWTANEAKIVFVENGGTDVSDMTGTTDAVITNTTMPATTKTGYTFAGWYNDQGFTGDKVTSLPAAYPAGTTTYYAKWTVTPITVDLNKLGGKDRAAVYKNLTISAGSNSLPSGFTATFEVTVTPEPQIQSVENSVYHGSVTMTKAGSAHFVFDKGIEFMSEGTYKYTVKETIPANKVSGITYDENTYTLTIVVDEGDNGLYVKQYYVGKEVPASGNVPVTITNTYYKHTYYPRPATPSKPALNTADHYAYVMGYPDGTVQPGGYITRAEASTIFFRLLTDETREQYWATTNAYSDVKGGDWYNNAISTLSNAGIVSGYPDGTFRPNASITRAEMSKIIALFAKLDKTTDRFSDIAGHWAEAYIKLAAGNGWIEGYPDGTFKPQQNITRAETVTMINRVLERVPSEESHLLPYASMLTFPDCQPGQWFYIAIQEATNSHAYERAATEKNGDEQWTALRENRDWTQLEK